MESEIEEEGRGFSGELRLEEGVGEGACKGEVRVCAAERCEGIEEMDVAYGVEFCFAGFEDPLG